MCGRVVTLALVSLRGSALMMVVLIAALAPDLVVTLRVVLDRRRPLGLRR